MTGAVLCSPSLFCIMKHIDFHGHCGIAHDTTYCVNDIVRYLKNTLINKMVISSLTSITSVERAEEELLELSKYPQFVLTYWINPTLVDWLPRLDTFSTKVKIAGIKLHPTANVYEPTAEIFRPIFKYCRKKHLFITIHTDTQRSSPHRLAEIIREFPEVDVVLIHMDDPVSSIYLAKKFKNVYLETSWMEQCWQLAPLQVAIDCLGPDRIFFGTDFPMRFPISRRQTELTPHSRSYPGILDCYKELFPKLIVEKICYKNARSFLEKHSVM